MPLNRYRVAKGPPIRQSAQIDPKAIREFQSKLKLNDITGDGGLGVEVLIRHDGNALWVNIAGKCVLRVYQVEGEVTVEDQRPRKRR